MSPTAVPSRITIEFRDAGQPTRTWVVGSEASVPLPGGHVGPSVLAAAPAATWSSAGMPRAVTSACACPDFCERDHDND